MIEILKHLYVWIVSPAAVGATAGYALYRREFFLGTLASASMLIAVAGGAMWLFEGHLLFYQLIYTALGAIPGLMGFATIACWLGAIFRSFRRSTAAEVSPNV